MVPPDVRIDSFVVPVVEARQGDGGFAEVTKYRGTGFLFGRRGAVMTAGHVVDEPSDELAVLTPGAGGGWDVWSVLGIERHSTEDVAVGLVPFVTSGAEVPYCR